MDCSIRYRPILGLQSARNNASMKDVINVKPSSTSTPEVTSEMKENNVRTGSVLPETMQDEFN
jgi:hypothetical protein